MSFDFEIGDLVRAERGDAMVQGVIYEGAGGFLQIGDGSPLVGRLLSQGYSFTLIRQAPPSQAPPSKAGIYKDRDDAIWVIFHDGGELVLLDSFSVFAIDGGVYVPLKWNPHWGPLRLIAVNNEQDDL